jgi:hypothetical protein
LLIALSYQTSIVARTYSWTVSICGVIMAENQGPGTFRFLMSAGEIVAAYPDLAELATEQSMAVELTNFDIASDELKAAHKDGVWQLCLRATDKEFTHAWTFGFHSHTGDPQFNADLAERRSTNGMSYARVTGVVDGIIGQWRHTAVSWRPGWPDGESAEMRKVLIMFRAGLPTHDPDQLGPTTEMTLD